MLAHLDALHAFAGLLVGFLVGLTGVGGGSLMTPVLVLLFGVSPATAVGTDLLFASTTKLVGTLVHGARATVDWAIVRRLAAGSVPAAVVALIALSRMGHPPASANHTILTSLGVMLILTAFATLFQKQLVRLSTRADHQPARNTQIPTVLLGIVLGTAVTLSSVGAGAMGVTVLLLIYPSLRISGIVGTDIAHAVPLTLIAGLGHWVIGDVNPALLVNLLIGSLPGVVLGSLLSTRSPDHALRPVLALVLLISGYKLLA